MSSVQPQKAPFLSEIYWPTSLIQCKTKALLIGWNLDAFRCCIACILPVPVSLVDDIQESLHFLQNDVDFHNIIKQCSNEHSPPPVILGEWIPRITGDDYTPSFISQRKSIWITLTGDEEAAYVKPTLYSLYSCGCIYSTTCFMYHFQDYSGAYDGMSMSLNSLKQSTMDDCAKPCREPFGRDSGDATVSKKTFLEQTIKQMLLSDEISEAIVVATLLLHRRKKLVSCAAPNRNDSVSATVTTAPPASVTDNLLRSGSNAWMGLVRLFAKAVSPSAQQRSLRVVVTTCHLLLQCTMSQATQRVKFLSSAVLSAKNASSTSAHTPVTSQSPDTSHPIPLQQQKQNVYSYFYFVCIDISLGIVCGALIIYFKSYLMDTIFSLAIMGQDELISIIEWMNRSPVGVKFNTLATRTISDCIIHVLRWFFSLFIPPVAAVARQPYPSVVLLLSAVLHLTAVSGCFGLSLQLCILVDVIQMNTRHIYLIWKVLEKCTFLQRSALKTLGYMFQGNKINILRNRRIDTCTFDKPQLMLGAVSFTILFFLLPSFSVYFVIMSAVHWFIFGVQYCLWSTANVLCSCPFFVLASYCSYYTELANALQRGNFKKRMVVEGGMLVVCPPLAHVEDDPAAINGASNASSQFASKLKKPSGRKDHMKAFASDLDDGDIDTFGKSSSAVRTLSSLSQPKKLSVKSALKPSSQSDNVLHLELIQPSIGSTVSMLSLVGSVLRMAPNTYTFITRYIANYRPEDLMMTHFFVHNSNNDLFFGGRGPNFVADSRCSHNDLEHLNDTQMGGSVDVEEKQLQCEKAWAVQFIATSGVGAPLVNALDKVCADYLPTSLLVTIYQRNLAVERQKNQLVFFLQLSHCINLCAFIIFIVSVCCSFIHLI